MRVEVRAEVESADHWKNNFKTHGDLFKTRGVTLAHMGVANDKTKLQFLKLTTLMNS